MIEEFDKGPWKVVTVGPNYADIYSDDFTHDVRISINGDFKDMEQRLKYAEALAATLNTTDALEQCHRELARTANAIDDIYRASAEGRDLIGKYYGHWHPQFVAELPEYKGIHRKGIPPYPRPPAPPRPTEDKQ